MIHPSLWVLGWYFSIHHTTFGFFWQPIGKVVNKKFIQIHWVDASLKSNAMIDATLKGNDACFHSFLQFTVKHFLRVRWRKLNVILFLKQHFYFHSQTPQTTFYNRLFARPDEPIVKHFHTTCIFKVSKPERQETTFY